MGGRTVRIPCNTKNDKLILFEAEFVNPETRPALETAAALTTLHRLKGEALAVQDLRFAIDEAGPRILRANFRARDFEVPGRLRGDCRERRTLR
jgi:hypothetical protein